MANRKQIVLDSYVVETLMRDLAGHERSPAAFLVFVRLWAESDGGANAFAASHQTLAAATGLSRRTVQAAIALLRSRNLIGIKRAHATTVPEYRVRRPWTRGRPLSSSCRADPAGRLRNCSPRPS